MLELLLSQYEFQFGTSFPLEKFTDTTEIDLINILYNCVQNNDPDYTKPAGENRFPYAPGQKG